MAALGLVLAACAGTDAPVVGGSPTLEVRATCDIVRAPGNMVATVTGATLTAETERGTDAATSVTVDLVDLGEVVDSASVDVPALDAGERREFEVGFPRAPEGGWPARPDARCVARLAR